MGLPDAAAADSSAVDQSGHRWLAGLLPGHRSDRSRRDDAPTARAFRALTDRALSARRWSWTGFLTAGVAFAVYLYARRRRRLGARAAPLSRCWFFAELLRSFGARSETKPVWRISLFSNVNLLVVVSLSIGFQIWSQHNGTLGRFLKTSSMPLTDCFLLLALGSIPFISLEMVKIVRHARSQKKTEINQKLSLAPSTAKNSAVINR